ncbi:YraN family protein, partial [Phascolarctobacterium succinatutens]
MGYKILTRNFRCHRYGEIDIIIEKSGCISFIEVKTRASTRFGR